MLIIEQRAYWHCSYVVIFFLFIFNSGLAQNNDKKEELLISLSGFGDYYSDSAVSYRSFFLEASVHRNLTKKLFSGFNMGIGETNWPLNGTLRRSTPARFGFDFRYYFLNDKKLFYSELGLAVTNSILNSMEKDRGWFTDYYFNLGTAIPLGKKRITSFTIEFSVIYPSINYRNNSGLLFKNRAVYPSVFIGFSHLFTKNQK